MGFSILLFSSFCWLEEEDTQATGIIEPQKEAGFPESHGGRSPTNKIFNTTLIFFSPAEDYFPESSTYPLLWYIEIDFSLFTMIYNAAENHLTHICTDSLLLPYDKFL